MSIILPSDTGELRAKARLLATAKNIPLTHALDEIARGLGDPDIREWRMLVAKLKRAGVDPKPKRRARFAASPFVKYFADIESALKDGHVVMFCGDHDRAAAIAPTVSAVEGSALVIDPNRHVADLTAEGLRKRGKRVVILSSDSGVGFNPLALVRGGKSCLEREGFQRIVDALLPRTDGYYAAMIRHLVVGIIASTMHDCLKCVRDPTMTEVIGRITDLTSETFKALTARMFDEGGCQSHFAEVALVELRRIDVSDAETLPNLIVSATCALERSTTDLADGAFKIADLWDGNTVLFVCPTTGELIGGSRAADIVVAAINLEIDSTRDARIPGYAEGRTLLVAVSGGQPLVVPPLLHDRWLPEGDDIGIRMVMACGKPSEFDRREGEGKTDTWRTCTNGTFTSDEGQVRNGSRSYLKESLIAIDRSLAAMDADWTPPCRNWFEHLEFTEDDVLGTWEERLTHALNAATRRLDSAQIDEVRRQVGLIGM